MASRGNNVELRRPAPRLYLSVPILGGAPPLDPAGIGAALSTALGAADVAAVLLRLPDADERSLINQVKQLAPIVQDRGTALLLAGHVEIAVKAGADGSHLSSLEEFRAALAMLKPDRIVGCGGLKSRHDAMVAAEQDADYVMFGEPDTAGHRPPFAAIVERVAWWAEVFEVPCVGWAGSAAEIEPIAKAGADFVAVGEWVFFDARGPAPAIAEVAARLALGRADA
jgi:thiamine-phosphate pyrophosphorylase